MHEQTGHYFGRARTYWWLGMHGTVIGVLTCCRAVCDPARTGSHTARASLSAQTPVTGSAPALHKHFVPPVDIDDPELAAAGLLRSTEL
jgi:hypothetical protein